MTDRYIRPYVPGAITTPGHVVVCVPGVRPAEVEEKLGEKITSLLIAGKVYEARVLMFWFGGQPESGGSDAEAG